MATPMEMSGPRRMPKNRPKRESCNSGHNISAGASGQQNGSLSDAGNNKKMLDEADNRELEVHEEYNKEKK